jgi:hypothetical protein
MLASTVKLPSTHSALPGKRLAKVLTAAEVQPPAHGTKTTLGCDWYVLGHMPNTKEKRRSDFVSAGGPALAVKACKSGSLGRREKLPG